MLYRCLYFIAFTSKVEKPQKTLILWSLRDLDLNPVSAVTLGRLVNLSELWFPHQ